MVELALAALAIPLTPATAEAPGQLVSAVLRAVARRQPPGCPHAGCAGRTPVPERWSRLFLDSLKPRLLPRADRTDRLRFALASFILAESYFFGRSERLVMPVATQRRFVA